MTAEPRAQTPPRLATGKSLPDVRIVAASAVFLHEDCDPARVARLSTRLREDGMLRNPPVVAPLPEDRYVVLDGANRTSALRALGANAIPVHVVDYEDPAVQLSVWYHLLLDATNLPARLQERRLRVRPATMAEAGRELEARMAACYLLMPREVFAVPSTPSLSAIAAILAQVVDTYKGTVQIYRVVTTDREVLTREYGSVGAVIVFPTFSKQDIRAMADAPTKLPTGVTRHIIASRALRLNVPLDRLTSAEPVEAKNQWLRELTHRKLLENRIRFYPEASYLFDE